jgi:hypothetical protein
MEAARDASDSIRLRRLRFLKENFDKVKGNIMFIEVKDNVTGTNYSFRAESVSYFYIKVNHFGVSQYIIVLMNGKEIVVTHKRWNKIRRQLGKI